MENEKDVLVPSDSTEPVVIYEDDAIMVVNKPYGMLVHGDHKESTGTLVEWFLARVPSARGVGEVTLTPQGEPIERSGVVHRLDRETSGVMVLCKTHDAHAFMKAQFHDRIAKKEYRAFVYGRVHERWGTINRPIGRSAKDFRLRSAQRGAKGFLRSAVTDWERIASGEYEGEPFSYMRLMPKTGRTHQIRVHLKAIDRPIVQDSLYGVHKIDTSNNLGLTRLALHSHILEITIPSGSHERFIAPVPPSFEAAAERIAE